MSVPEFELPQQEDAYSSEQLNENISAAASVVWRNYTSHFEILDELRKIDNGDWEAIRRQELDREEVRNKVTQTKKPLEAIGLKLAVVSETETIDDVLLHNPEQEMFNFELEDANRFIGYLKSLSKDSVALDDKLKQALTLVIRNLVEQMTMYNWEEADDRLIELLGHGYEIVAEYRRLGFNDEIAPLARYMFNVQRGVAKEYHKFVVGGFYTTDGINLSFFAKIEAPENYLSEINSKLFCFKEITINNKTLPLLFETCTVAIEEAQAALVELEKLAKQEKNTQQQKELLSKKEYTEKYIKKLQSLKNRYGSRVLLNSILNT